jgi:hypothetical protein
MDSRPCSPIPRGQVLQGQAAQGSISLPSQGQALCGNDGGPLRRHVSTGEQGQVMVGITGLTVNLPLPHPPSQGYEGTGGRGSEPRINSLYRSDNRSN